jgi:integrase
VTLLNTGLRIAEALAMDRCQVDTSHDIITIDRLLCKTTREVRMITKGKKIRHIGINDEVKEALYPTLSEDGPIFPYVKGAMTTQETVGKFFNEACTAAKVKKIGLHGLRHTFASQYMMNGGNIWDLQKILGHSTVALTDKYYAHFSREHVKNRASVVKFGGNVLKVNFKGAG